MQQSRFHLPNLLPSTPVGGSTKAQSPSPSTLRGRARDLREQASRNGSNTSLPAASASNFNEDKDETVLDWYVEGPGRRVGYDDLTAIDWIFEYSKERQRMRILRANTPGLIGYVRQMVDASHVWIVLILTGILTGVIAAAISIASDWLGDIKFGYCKASDGGEQFYLNKAFCCWGHEEMSQCQNWKPWREALRIPSQGGGYVVEFIFYVLYSILFAIGAAALVKQYSLYAKHSGIPELKTILGGFVIRSFLGAWTLIIKSLGLCLSVASGLWVGKEGPLVHVACCCANLIMKPIDTLRQNEARKREVLSAAAAAGISVAFGAPIGGVLFSLEQLSYYFPDKTMWQSFVCAMVAAVTLQALNPFHTGKIVLYEVRYTTGWHSFELFPFVFLGLMGGIYGGFFIKINMLIARFRRSPHNPLKGSPVWEVVVIALMSAMINFPNTFMRAQLSELVAVLFAECATIGNDDQFGLCKVTTAGSISIVSVLLAAAGLGFLLASVTFGLQLPAGIILPSIAIGALYGRALGIIVELFQRHHSASFVFSACEPDVQCVTPGTYAIIGAASALAGVTRMTVSIVVIMFELTGALTYVLPIMITVMLAKWIGDTFSKRGIYESWIQFNEYPYLANNDDTPPPDVPVSNMMTRIDELTCIDTTKKHTIDSLTTLLNTTTFRGFPVITSAKSEPTTILSPVDITPLPADAPPPPEAPLNTLLGYISRTELSYALSLASSPSPAGRNLPPQTSCFFLHEATALPNHSLDLRPWMDQTPITLSAASNFALAVNIFQKLGLRYVLFIEKGALKGLLTKKDVWWVLNADEKASTGKDGDFVAGAGVLRQDNERAGEHDDDEEDRGLLNTDRRARSGTLESED